MTPEFSHPVRLDEIGREPVAVRLSAKKAEREALCARFGWLALERLDAALSYHRAGDAVELSGTLSAQLTRPCVASNLPVAEAVKAPLHVRFVAVLGEDEEVELDAEECDTIEHDGRTVDLGEAVAQTLALALDPFPRSADADTVLKKAGVLGEGEAGPFAALKVLKGLG